MTELQIAISVPLLAISVVLGMQTTIQAIIDQKVGLGSLILMILGIFGTIPALVIALFVRMINKLDKKVIWRW